MAVPPPPPRPANTAPKPPGPPAPAAAAKPATPAAAATTPAAAAPAAAKTERVVKFGDAKLPVPTEIGGVDFAWFKEVVKTATDQLEAGTFAKFGKAFEDTKVASFPNTSEGKRAYKLAKAIAVFSAALHKPERAPRVAGKVADRVRATLLEMVKLVGVEICKKQVGDEKWATYGFTAEELA